jgi:mutator protein MutT
MRGGKALAVRRPSRGLLGGLWDLPGGELAAGEAPREGLRRALRERVGLELSRAAKIGEVAHEFTHRRLTLHVFHASTQTSRIRLRDFTSHKWLEPRALTSLPHAALTARALELLSAARGARSN